ncbi:MAG TPA: helix-turn-helix domain-containing protein, partial [Aggregatilineales bacterium]|nr:helix-turn-helix domain-containing protein [Aggregatilineales bacterium]
TGIGTTKLHTLFRQHYHTTPAAYLNRIRIAAACRLLADPKRQVGEVAYAVGYESLSAFHDNFRKATGLSPSDYQHIGTTFTLSLPENYLAWVALKLLGRDPDSKTERVEGRHAVKAVALPLADGSQPVVIHLDFEDQRVACRVESAQALDTSALHAAHAVILRMLGFGSNPVPFERQIATRPDLVGLIEGRSGLRIPLSADLFEGITWAIVGQQVNLAFAFKMRRALAELCGTPVAESVSGLYVHPTPERVAALDYSDLTARQFSRMKAEYLIDTARLLVSGDLSIDSQGCATQIEKRLHAVRGLGPWSVNYIMMRALGFADCVPLGDTGLSTSLHRFFALDHRPERDEVGTLMEPFAPFRSLATYHLWMSLGVTPA